MPSAKDSCTCGLCCPSSYGRRKKCIPAMLTMLVPKFRVLLIWATQERIGCWNENAEMADVVRLNPEFQATLPAHRSVSDRRKSIRAIIWGSSVLTDESRLVKLMAPAVFGCGQ